MEQIRIFYVNTKQTFAGSSLWSEELLRQELGNGKWEVFWTNYSDEHPELADVNRPEGELTADEVFSLIDRFNSNVGVLRLHQKADSTLILSFDTDYWISPTQLCTSSKTARGIDKSGFLYQLADRTEKFKCGQLYRAMRLNEVFDLNFFEELVCTKWHNEETFLIHKEDIEPNGKFHQFSQYTIETFSKEFGIMIKCH